MNICTEDAFHEFLKEFEQSTSTVYNIYFGDNKGNGVIWIEKILSYQRKYQQSETVIVQNWFKIGKDVTDPKKSGKKKKNWKLIPIQVTAKSRRRYKQGTRKLVSGGIRIPDNPMLVRQTVLKTMCKTSLAEGPALVAKDFLKS